MPPRRRTPRDGHTAERHRRRTVSHHLVGRAAFPFRPALVEESCPVGLDPPRHNDIGRHPVISHFVGERLGPRVQARPKGVRQAEVGDGASAPDDVDVRIRPHRRSRIPGRTRSVSMITDRIIWSKLVRHMTASWPVTVVGGGPPVLFTRMSTGRASFRFRLRATPSDPGRPGPISSGNALTPAASTRVAVAASASADLPAPRDIGAFFGEPRARSRCRGRRSRPAPGRYVR